MTPQSAAAIREADRVAALPRDAAWSAVVVQVAAFLSIPNERLAVVLANALELLREAWGLPAATLDVLASLRPETPRAPLDLAKMASIAASRFLGVGCGGALSTQGCDAHLDSLTAIAALRDYAEREGEAERDRHWTTRGGKP